MTSGLAWLNELMVWLGKWFPRIVLVKVTHQGVKFLPGGRMGLYPAGLYCYWPITTEFVVVSTRERTTEVAAILCGREVASAAVAWAITNPLAALQQYADIFATLDDRIQAALLDAYAPDKSNQDIAEAVERSVGEYFCEHGIVVYSVSIIQRGRVIPLKNLNDWAQHAKAEL